MACSPTKEQSDGLAIPELLPLWPSGTRHPSATTGQTIIRGTACSVTVGRKNEGESGDAFQAQATVTVGAYGHAPGVGPPAAARNARRRELESGFDGPDWLSAPRQGAQSHCNTTQREHGAETHEHPTLFALSGERFVLLRNHCLKGRLWNF